MANSFSIDARLALVGLVVVAAQPRSMIAQQGTGEEQIVGLVRQLGDDSYTARLEASRSLGSLGGLGRAELERATASEDAEVALRAKRLLRQLAKNDLWSGSHLTLPDGPIPLVDAVESIRRQSGNSLLLPNGPSTYRDSTIRLGSESWDYWRVVDALCRQSGNSVRPHLDPQCHGLTIVGRPPGRNPVAYAGAMRAELSMANSSFVDEIDGRDRTSGLDDTVLFPMHVLWEDRLQLVAYRSQPQVVRAELPSGKCLCPAGSRSGDWRVVGRKVHQLAATLHLEPPPAAADRLTRLVVQWPMIAVGDVAELTVYGPTAGSVYNQDDLSLAIDEMRPTPDGRYEVIVRIGRDLVHPEPAEVLLLENKIEFFDVEGRAFARHQGGECLVGEAVRETLTLHPPAAVAAPAMLRLTYPRIRDSRNVQFEFQDVPLPRVRPD